MKTVEQILMRIDPEGDNLVVTEKIAQEYADEFSLNFLDYLENNYYYDSGSWKTAETDENVKRSEILKEFKQTNI